MEIKDLERREIIQVFTDFFFLKSQGSSTTGVDMQDVCYLLNVIGLLKKTGKWSISTTAAELEKRLLLCCTPCLWRNALFLFETIFYVVQSNFYWIFFCFLWETDRPTNPCVPMTFFLKVISTFPFFCYLLLYHQWLISFI